MLLSSEFYNLCDLGWGYLTTESSDSLIMWSRDMQKKTLVPPPLKMATGNLVNLKKTSEMSQIKDEFLASYSKQNFGRKLKKN